jgi:hypothetical protein
VTSLAAGQPAGCMMVLCPPLLHLCSPMVGKSGWPVTLRNAAPRCSPFLLQKGTRGCKGEEVGDGKEGQKEWRVRASPFEEAPAGENVQHSAAQHSTADGDACSTTS